MSDNVQIDETIEKKLIYKFEKLLGRFSSEYLKLYRDDSQEDITKTISTLNEDIDLLQYDAFKYSAALASIERDDLNNELELEDINQHIISTNAEIKNMQEELRCQQVIKVNKEEFNCIAREVRNFDTKTEMDKKIEQADNEIKMLEEEHKQDMDNIARQESYLRTALSAMACLVNCHKKGMK